MYSKATIMGKVLQTHPHRAPGQNLLKLTPALGKSGVQAVNHLGYEDRTTASPSSSFREEVGRAGQRRLRTGREGEEVRMKGHY